MGDNSQPMTPSETLAIKIVERLKAEALIHEADADSILQKLKSGSASASDWNRWAERKLDVKKEVENE